MYDQLVKCHVLKPRYMRLVSNLFVQIFALFSSYFISIDADSIISSETLFFMGPSNAIGELSVSPLHVLLNKVGQLLVAMAGERVLSTGYSLNCQEKSTMGLTIIITYKLH